MAHVHGDHWEAIEGDAEKTVTHILPYAIEHGKVAGKSEFDCTGDDGVVRREKAFGLVHGEMPLRYFALICSNSGAAEPCNSVYSFYPFCASGITHRLTIEKLHPWENGVEGVVQASTESGALIWFFDPYFFKDKDTYQVGQSYNICLGALAMALQPPTQHEIVVTSGPIIEIERKRALEEDPAADVSKITSVTFGLDNCSFCMPSEMNPDEASYRGMADEVGYFELEKSGIYRIKTAIMRPEDSPVEIYLYASESVLKDYCPKAGDNLEGNIWLQGYIQD